MKVAYISTFKNEGGAAIACERLIESVQKFHPNIQTSLVYLEKKGILNNISNLILLVLEKVFLRVSLINKKDLFKFSIGFFGQNLSKRKEIKKADIIHLHWFNNGFLSLYELQKIVDLKKPIVWTMHDMWAFTGGCHYNKGCEQFRKNCQSCIYLKNDFFSEKNFELKMGIYAKKNLTFVGCSNWMSNLGKQSKLLKTQRVLTINNPLDNDKYFVLNQEKCREKLSLPTNKSCILFASAKVEDPRKGLNILLNSLVKLKRSDIHLILVGTNKEELNIDKSISYSYLGFINDSKKMNEIYCAADIFACPSLEDNLPNTIMESLFCNTPVVAFNVGGISDMIIHNINGQLVEYNSEAQDNFTHSIEIQLNKKEINQNISNQAKLKFSYKAISNQYTNLYFDLLNSKTNY